MSKVERGDRAPHFLASAVNATASEAESLHFMGEHEKPVVLYFYPKDDTPGCTKQACGLRDGWDKIGLKATVYGVSPNSVLSHGKFIKKYNLPFSLIADEDHRIADAYGVWVEKTLYGRKYMGVERTTFVIGRDGRILEVFRKVKPEKHLEMLLTVLD